MQPLHHLTVEPDRAARGVFRQLKGCDDLAGLRDLFLWWREDRIAGLDLAGMDQRLAVEAEIARLRAFLPKAVEIAEIAVGSVEDFEAMRAGGENAVGDHRDHRRATRQHPDPRLTRNIVRPEYKSGERRPGIARSRRKFLA